MRCRPLRWLLALALAAAAPPLAAQHGIRQLTTRAEAHQNAKISPDGQLVAFAGPGKLGVAGYATGAEGTLHASPTLGDFLWSPTSSGLYFLDNNQLKFVARVGGGATTLRALPGQQIRLWCVDSSDRNLWGTRYDLVARKYHVFTVPTNGSSAPVDVLGSVLVLDEVRLDPTEQFILYRAFAPSTPFAPAEYLRADIDGQNPISLTGGEIGGQPAGADWADAGQSIVFEVASPVTARRHIARIGPSGTQIRFLTEGTESRRIGDVDAGQGWIVLQASYAGGAATAPAVLPIDGGGLVRLARDGVSYAFQGPPTVDDSGTRVAFAASVDGELPQVFVTELDRELRIRPRAEVGRSFRVDLPVAATETGLILLGIRPLLQPFTLPGFTDALLLEPAVLVPGTPVTPAPPWGPSIGASIPIPPATTLVGATVLFQGVRLRSATTGAFTRQAELLIF